MNNKLNVSITDFMNSIKSSPSFSIKIAINGVIIMKGKMQQHQRDTTLKGMEKFWNF